MNTKEELQIVMKQSEILKKSEFVSSFQKVIELVLRIEQKFSKAISDLQHTYAVMMDRMKTDHSMSISEMKSTMKDMADKSMQKMMADHEAKMKAMDEKMDSITDGKDADEERIVEDVLAQIKLPEQKDVILDNPEQMRDKLERLKGKERLSVSAIDGLDEKLEEVKTSAKAGHYVPGGAKGRVHYIDLTSQCTGSNKSFEIPFNFGVVGIFSTQSPMNYRPLVDWTLSGKILTLTAAVEAPATSQTLWAIYIR